MTASRQYIKDRMMQSAARFWGLPETDTEASFDPLVGLLMGACAAELEKIDDEIESSRARVLERLVQLLSPEALTGVLPAHAIAYALPTEPTGKISPKDQFYVNKQISTDKDKNTVNDIYFSPAGNFLLHKAAVKLKASGNKMVPVDSSNADQVTATGNKSLPQNQLWLGIETPALNVNGLRFYFDVVHQHLGKQFFEQLPKAKWYTGGQLIPHQTGYPVKTGTAGYFNLETVLNRDISVTEKYENHIHDFYRHHFITLKDEAKSKTVTRKKDLLPDAIKEVFDEKALTQVAASKLHWICLEFPENINSYMLEEVMVFTNCFPVVNRHLYDISYRLKEFVNIIPLLSEETFLDIYSVVNQQGRQLHLKNNSEGEENDLSILLRFGGVGRFDKREAAETVDKIIQLLREETAAFSILGNDFIQNEMTLLQQTMNKLEQQVSNKHLLKGSTPYLIINNRAEETNQTVYVKFWSSNGAEANAIKAQTPLHVYSNSLFETGTARLVTSSQGGRNKLNDSEKVLAYKSALLSKQKLVTNEDVAAFCRMRLANIHAKMKIEKGSMVMPGRRQGLIRTLEVHIYLQQKDLTSLEEKGTVEFWQTDLEKAIEAHSNFFIPVKVFIKEEKNLMLQYDQA